MARNQERKQEIKIIASTSTWTLATTRATPKRERISENHKHQSQRNAQSSNRSNRSQVELQCQSESQSKNNTEVEEILDSAQTDNSTKTSTLLANKLFRFRSKSGISQPFWPLLLLILLSIQLVNGLPSPSASNRHHSHLSKLVNGSGRDRRDQVSFIVDGRWNAIDQQLQEDGEPISNGKGKDKAQEEEMMQDLDSSRAPNQLIESDGIAGNSTQSSSSGGERPTRRWGHSSSFLNGTISNDKSRLLFIGGQVDKRGQITNDVWSLDLTDLTSSSNSTSTSNSSSLSANQWTRLSSSNLPPTAFSSSVLLPGSNNGEDQVWLIGGLTMDCMKDSPVYVWKNSTGWNSPENIQESPMRRKGAVALTVPRHLGQKSSSKGNGTLEMDGVMVLGGISDESTCYQPSNSSSSSSSENPKQVNYFGLDIWSQSSKSSSSKSNISPSSRSFSLDSRMKTLSLVDSSTVLIPNHQNTSLESPSHDPRVAFMGGKTLSGKWAPLDHFWVLELNSGNWERWVSISKDPSGIPVGRVGHSTSMTSSGKIVMFGGYLNETDRVPTNELWVLDTKKNPAEWQKLESGGKPRAFHSANVINDVMVIGFGDDGMESMKRDDDVGRDDHLSFLDTQDQDPKNWKWSKDVKGVMDGRSSRVSTSAQSASMDSNSQSSPPESSNESSISAASNSNGNEASNQQGESLSGNQVGAAASESSTNSPSTSDPTSNDQGSASTPDSNPQSAPASAQQGTDSPSSPSPESNNSGNSLKTSPPASNSGDEDESSGSQSGSSKKSGAIAGSVLGAAALLGTMGGLYAHKKRKDFLYESSSTPFDSSDPRFGFVDGGKKHNFEPVSNLWLTTPVAWASKGLKRRASETSSLGNSISGLLFGKSDSKGRRGSSTSNDSSNSTTETLWEKDDIYTVPSQPPRVAVVTTNNLGKSSDSKGMNVFRKISTSNKINALKSKRRSISSSLIGRNGRSPIEDSEAQLNGLNSFNDRRVSQGFISSIIHGDDEERTISPTEHVSPDLPRPMRSGFFNQQRKNSFPSPPIAAAMLSHQHQPERILRAPSCESLGGASSDGSASHCSYPFLSAMHRPSLANLTGVSSSASEASISRENVNESESETSPREKLLRKMVKEMRSEVDAENNHHHSSGTDLENGRNQILNPFSTPQEEDEDEMLASNSDDEEGIRSHLREESKLHQAHKRAMELNHLKSPSNQTDFDSDDEEIVTRNEKSIVNTPQQQRSNQNFQTPIFSWEPIRSPKVSMNGPYPTSTPTTGNSNRGKRLGAALLFSAGNKTLLKSSTADLSPRDPTLSPDAQVFEDSNGTPLSIAAERAELLILMDDKDSLEQRKKSQKRARKSLLRVTNES